MKKIAVITVVAVCALLLVVGVALLTSYRAIITPRVTQEVVFTNSSEAYDKWKNPPITIFFKVWIFNITNSQEFLKNTSSDLTVEEIGPYVYEEVKVKEIFNETQDEVTYVPKSIFKFRPDLSEGRTLSDNFTTLNIPLLTVLGLDETSQNMGEKKFKFLASFVRGYLKGKFGENSIIVTKTVDQLVLGGYIPEIFGKLDTTARAAGLKMPMNFTILLEKNNNTQMPGNWTVKTGVNDASKLATLVAWNNKTFNPIWHGNTSCSQLRGTDGQQFPTGVTESTPINVFVPDLCRDLSFKHSGSGEIGGLDGLRFDLEQLYDSQNDKDTCYCMKNDTSQCYTKGLMDIAKCRYDSPIVVSQPHFLAADDELITSVKNNVTPADASTHSSYLYIEPWTGVPLEVSVKLQLNFELKTYTVYNITNKRQVVPLLWFEQSAKVNDRAVDQLNSLLFNKIKALKGVSGAAIGLAVIVVVAIIIKQYMNNRKNAYV